MTTVNPFSPQMQRLAGILDFEPEKIIYSSGGQIRSRSDLGRLLAKEKTTPGFFTVEQLIDMLGYEVKIVSTVYPLAIEPESGAVFTLLATENKGRKADVPTHIWPTGMWEPHRQVEVVEAAARAVGETLPMTALREFDEEAAHRGVEENLTEWGISISLHQAHRTLYVIYHYVYSMSVAEMEKAIADMDERWSRPEEERNPEERFETYDLKRVSIVDIDLPRLVQVRQNEATINGLPIAHRQDRIFWAAIQKNVPQLADALRGVSAQKSAA